MRVLFCEACGSPLDAPWADLVIVCRSCGGQNMPGRPGGPVPASVPADGRPRLNLGGRSYVLEGLLGEGDSSSVYRARWVVRLGEAVVIKVQAAATDSDLLRREWQTLKALHASSAQGAEHFRTRLPQPIAHGLVDSDRPRTATVTDWKSGFCHTLEEAGEVHRSGVPGQVQVWVLKRLLELLSFVHRSGFVHGAVTPEHVLIHPRDHGAMLVGWTLAQPWQSGRALPLLARPQRWTALYGGASQATPELDIAMACRCARALGGWDLPDAVRPDPIARVIAQGESGAVDDAWLLRDGLNQASDAVYGPPGYNPLPMPGWR